MEFANFVLFNCTLTYMDTKCVKKLCKDANMFGRAPNRKKEEEWFVISSSGNLIIFSPNVTSFVFTHT